MREKLYIKAGYLYPRLMNLYGDRGNMIALQRRASWQGITLAVDMLEVGQALHATEYDLLFIGGGQDREQKLIADDMVLAKGDAIVRAIESDCAVLAICGGYQLLGRYYQIDEGNRLPGIGIFPVWTESGAQRMICNTAIQTDLRGSGEAETLVGFVNHGGQTYLDEGAQPLGRIIAGEGNHLDSPYEGCVLRKAIGTYLHGALLPKNPWLTDYLLQQALAHRGIDWQPQPLDDAVELRAHRDAIELAKTKAGHGKDF